MNVDITEYTPRQLEVNETLLDLGFKSIGFGSPSSLLRSTAVLDTEPAPVVSDFMPHPAASEKLAALSQYQLVGDYDLSPPTPVEYISLNFNTTLFRLIWANCSRLADLLADVFAPLCLNQAGSPSNATLTETSGAISFIANELIENALKFHVDPALPVTLTVSLYPTRLVLLVSNKVSRQAGVEFKERLEVIAAGDPTELLLERMEENALDPEGKGSGLGILTILSDYQAKAGWKFETLAGRANEQTVSSMVQLSLS